MFSSAKKQSDTTAADREYCSATVLLNTFTTLSLASLIELGRDLIDTRVIGGERRYHWGQTCELVGVMSLLDRLDGEEADLA